MRDRNEVILNYDIAPNAFRFMLKALVPSPGLAGGADRIVARWRGHKPESDALVALTQFTGLPTKPYLPVIYPYVIGFRLQMAVLTHTRYPLPIWGALQVRNCISQHRLIPFDSVLELESVTAERRSVPKGVEVDLLTVVRIGADVAWESTNTFFYRGRHGAPDARAKLAAAPDTPSDTIAEWEMPASPVPMFARLTGDHNGIHRWDWYARRFGFKRAFVHPQLAVGQCLSRLPGGPSGPGQRLNIWLKGPVYVGSRVALLAASDPASGKTFALHVDGDERPAIVGQWCMAA